MPALELPGFGIFALAHASLLPEAALPIRQLSWVARDPCTSRERQVSAGSWQDAALALITYRFALVRLA